MRIGRGTQAHVLKMRLWRFLEESRSPRFGTERIFSRGRHPEPMAAPIGSVVFVLPTHLPWVLGHGRWPHGEDWLYAAAGGGYVPILRLLRLQSAEETQDRNECNLGGRRII